MGIRDSLFLYFIYSILMIANLRNATSIDSTQCDTPLGMENGIIKDEQLSASSSYFNGNVGPQHSRLSNEIDGGAWCPKVPVTSQTKEWLQIDLGAVHMISASATQGRFGNGQGVEFTEAYLLEYWRPNLGKWQKYRNISGHEILTGNSNTYTVQKNFLEPVILASKIRFVPYSYHERTVCMRVEIFGCKWTEGILSYSMPQGDVRGNWKFFDITYDGIWNDQGLQKGLGQLIDGKFSPDDFRFVPNSLSLAHQTIGGGSKLQFQGDTGIQQWVGWRSDAHGNEPIELIFEFDQLRIFSAIHIFCNNQFTKEIQVFSEAKLWFNDTSPTFNGQSLSYEYVEDRIFESARNITIYLHRRIGKFIKVQLAFASKWILISEIVFDSEVVQEGFTMDPKQIEDPIVQEKESNILNQKEIRIKTVGQEHQQERQPQPQQPRQNHHQSISKKDQQSAVYYTTIVIGILASIILLLTITVCVIVNRRRGQKFIENALKSSNPNGSSLPQKNSLYTTPADILSDNYHYQQSNYIQKKKYMDIEALQTNNNCALFSNGTTDSLLDRIEEYQEPYQALKYAPYYSYSTVNMELQNKSSSTSSTTATNSEISHDYATPEIGLKPLLDSQQQQQHQQQRQHSPRNNTHLKTNSKRNYNHSSHHKSPVKKDMVKDLRKRLDQTNVHEFPRHRLRMLTKLSEGSYGTVYIAEATGIPDYKSENSSTPKRLVALKFLMKSASEKEKKEFYRDVKILAALENVNITRVLGMCSLEDPLCVIMEYLEHGDLCQFLKSHISAENICDLTSTPFSQMSKSLSYNCLLYISTQIASGMRYLESLNFVHRDLATRNCLIGKGYQIKICDFGTDNDLYANDYYKVDDNVPIPIRWMAWESIFYAKYTIKSDVWAFGVTLWEILSLCRFVPYHELSNEQVLDNLSALKQSPIKNHLLLGDSNDNNSYGSKSSRDEQVFACLPRPAQAIGDIYDLMLSCWQQKDSDRPTFQDILLFLQERNVDFSPN